MSEQYEGKQYVGMDLHRRRSVLVRMSEAGESPEVVLEATYGWYWAAGVPELRLALPVRIVS